MNHPDDGQRQAEQAPAAKALGAAFCNAAWAGSACGRRGGHGCRPSLAQPASSHSNDRGRRVDEWLGGLALELYHGNW